MSQPPEPHRLRPPDVALGLLLVGLGLAARCARWRNVFTPEGIELVPADSHYYIRLALRQLAQFPHFDRFDPYVNYPTGAEIYWPPLHTWIVGVFLMLFGLNQLELGAAWVDPSLAVAEMVILGLIAFRLYGRLVAGTVLALYGLLPASIYCSPLGNADHHVHEPFFAALTCLLLGAAVERPSNRMAVWIGLALGASRLFTPIEPLLLVPTAATLVVALALRSSSQGAPLRWLALGVGVTAAVTLLASALLFGEPASLEYEPLSSFQPLFALGLFVGANAVGAMLHRERRWWAWAIGAIVCVLPLMGELRRALSHLGRADAILAVVHESQPLSWSDARDFLTVLLLTLPLIVIGALRQIRGGTLVSLPGLVFALLLSVPAMKQNRFVQVFAGALIVLAALALPSVFESIARARLWKRALYAVGGGVLLMSFLSPLLFVTRSEETPLVRNLMFWIRSHTPPASVDPMGDTKPLWSVVANPMLGHFLVFWADRPAVASSFSQAPAHVAGNERVADVFAATSEVQAYDRIQATGGRYLLVTPLLKPFGRDNVDPEHTYLASLLNSPRGKAPDAAHFRMIYNYEDPESGQRIRLFEVAPGARLQGTTTPNAAINVELELLDQEGRRLLYQVTSRAGADGRFSVQVPYPTEDPQGGLVAPAGSRGLWVSNGQRAVYVHVSPEAVRQGDAIPVNL